MNESRQGRKADDLASDDFDSVAFRFHPDCFQYTVDWVFPVVGNVHRNLDNSLVFELYSACLDGLEAASRLADGARDSVRHVDIIRSEIDVVGDQREARTDGGDDGGGMDSTLAKVGLPIGDQQLVCHTIELQAPDVIEDDAIRGSG